MQVTHNEKQSNAAMRMVTSQQSTRTAMDMVVRMQPGQEAELAAYVLALLQKRNTGQCTAQLHNMAMLLLRNLRGGQSLSFIPLK